LIGGLYGVYVGGVFSGESMFFKTSNASKHCLYHLIEALRNSGLQWMDIQMVTPVSESVGGKYISREDFQARLKKAHAKPPELLFSSDKKT
jgi:leucyl/phenylalanyl-tRNA--protein transferase